jgi:predicted type IV restriction endonuclease
MPIPTRVNSRLIEGLKRFQPIIESAKTRDINESDTVVLMTGILSDLLGYDKYTDITTELAIRGTFCDLALKIDGKLQFLLEAKAIGTELKETHIKQAVDYAANKGLEWVILSNAVSWKVFRVVFSKPINHILVIEINLLTLSHKNAEDIEALYLLAKEAISKSLLDEFFSQKQATNRFIIGNLVYSDAIINSLRKELKVIYPDIKVHAEEIKNVLLKEILKREILEGEESEDAKKKIAKSYRKKEKSSQEKTTENIEIVKEEASLTNTSPVTSESDRT